MIVPLGIKDFIISSNLFDAAALGAIAALKSARFPKRVENVVEYGELTDEVLPIVSEPVAITVIKIGDKFLVDPLPEEETLTEARLTVAVTRNGEICALQKGGSAPLSVEDIGMMVDLALEKAPELRKKM